ncbi:MAG: hypothetical protein U5R49_00245 [Deltaproteobacteria bacterium]|nr:hypothetical protein [Deltaproteobacteria bacterium]
MTVRFGSPFHFRERLDHHWPLWAAGALKGLSALVRTRLVGADQGNTITCGVAHWHGDELALLPASDTWP